MNIFWAFDNIAVSAYRTFSHQADLAQWQIMLVETIFGHALNSLHILKLLILIDFFGFPASANINREAKKAPETINWCRFRGLQSLLIDLLAVQFIQHYFSYLDYYWNPKTHFFTSFRSAFSSVYHSSQSQGQFGLGNGHCGNGSLLIIHVFGTFSSPFRIFYGKCL